MNPTRDLRSARWRKSSYSNGDNGACVEIADGLPGIVPLRDSKVQEGAVVIVSAGAWTAFIRNAVK